MATLIYNGDLTVLSSKVVKTLANRSCGTEDIASRCCTTRDTIRKELSRLKAKDAVEHDGCRPRTWALKGMLPPKAPPEPVSTAPRVHPWRTTGNWPTPKAGTAKAKNFGPKRRFWHSAEIEYLIEMRDSGASNADIARELMRTATAVQAKVGDLRDRGFDIARAKSGAAPVYRPWREPAAA